MENNKCPICWKKNGLNNNNVNCSSCWTFRCTPRFRSNFDKNRKDIKLIQWVLRELQLKWIKIDLFYDKDIDEIKKSDQYTIDTLLKLTNLPKNITQKIDKFLENLEIISKWNWWYVFESIKYYDYPYAYANDENEFKFILWSMKSELFFNAYQLLDKWPRFSLSLKAWQKIEELKQVNKDSNQWFIASKFKNHDKHIDAISNGIKKSKYIPKSIKYEQYPETILEKWLWEIRKSRFVIADITDERPSVFVEIWFALWLWIDVIFVVNKQYWRNEKKRWKQLEFYSLNYKINEYESESELEEIVEQAIRSRIESR